MHILPLLLVGLVAGISSGFFGIGGGIVLIPLLVFVFGFSQQTANGTSLVALLLPVGLLGALAYYHAGKISLEHVKSGLVIALGIFLGTYFGARFAVSLSDAVLRRAFAIFLVVIAVRIWIAK